MDEVKGGLFLGVRKIADGINRALVATSRAHGLLRSKDVLNDPSRPTAGFLILVIKA
jgi:hypothetical protein